jgi:hypothetical protein
MNLLVILIVLALAATIASLGAGIASMMKGGEFDQAHSTQLMALRVGSQGVTLLLLFIALAIMAF